MGAPRGTPFVLNFGCFGADDGDVVGDRGSALQQVDEATFALLRVVDGLADVLLVVEALALHSVDYLEAAEAALDQQLLGVERALDGDFQRLGCNLLLLQNTHNSISRALRRGAQHQRFGVQILHLRHIGQAKTAVVEADGYFLNVFHNQNN